MPTPPARCAISSRPRRLPKLRDFTELGVEELRAWNDSGKGYVLLDVRQPHELTLASVPGALSIPMTEVQARVAEIPADTPLVVMCHYGERSARVARFLVTNGFSDVYNLDGGIDAYASQIDASVGRY
jgi:rhodanese-related sulfurtransferase